MLSQKQHEDWCAQATFMMGRLMHLIPTILIGVIIMAVLGGCGGLPDNEGKTRSQVISDGADTRLGQDVR